MLSRILIIGCLLSFLSPIDSYGKEITLQLQDGTLMLADLIKASEEIADCTPSKRVPTGIPGKIVMINDIPYEVRFFSFEDTTGKLEPNTTFADYVQQNKLQSLRSIVTTPLPQIKFESFDFRKNPKKDGVYFSMALRRIENGDS